MEAEVLTQKETKREIIRDYSLTGVEGRLAVEKCLAYLPGEYLQFGIPPFRKQPGAGPGIPVNQCQMRIPKPETMVRGTGS